MGQDFDVTAALESAESIIRYWVKRTRPMYADDFRSACGLAIAEASRKWDPERCELAHYLRYLMHKRCRDTARRLCVDRRGKLWECWRLPEWWEPEPPPYDDHPWRFRQAMAALDVVEAEGLASAKACRAVRLYIELRSMEPVAAELGVTESRVSQLMAEAARQIRLKVAV